MAKEKTSKRTIKGQEYFVKKKTINGKPRTFYGKTSTELRSKIKEAERIAEEEAALIPIEGKESLGW
ncbi:MAG: hypothetical protein FWG30_01135 [Eubacteriaceae bacterium]|nr:hypothetical protein [Eubacteriaceae bacterium]